MTFTIQSLKLVINKMEMRADIHRIFLVDLQDNFGREELEFPEILMSLSESC